MSIYKVALLKGRFKATKGPTHKKATQWPTNTKAPKGGDSYEGADSCAVFTSNLYNLNLQYYIDVWNLWIHWIRYILHLWVSWNFETVEPRL